MPSAVQKIYKYSLYLLAGMFFLGVFLDTISNAIALITPKIAVWGTGFILLAWFFLELKVYLSGIAWHFPGGKNLTITAINSQIRLFLLGLIITLWIPSLLRSQNQVTPELNIFKPLFAANDTSSFNVLILNFEDYIAKEDTDCIGRSIQENLNVAHASEELVLPLVAKYADSIPPPKTIEAAKAIQKKHHADLIIYGLARNLEEACAGAEVCFRYNIADAVVAQLDSVIEMNTEKHDLDYFHTSPIALEKGMLKIDALSLKSWISALVKIKAKEQEEAFVELDRIGSDMDLSIIDRMKRFLYVANTYTDLDQYDKAAQAFSKIIELAEEGIDTNDLNENIDKVNIESRRRTAYGGRAWSYTYLGKYKLALKDYETLLNTYGEDIDFYTEIGLIYGYLGNYDLAILNFNKVVELDSTDINIHYRRGEAYCYAKQYNLAIKDLNKAVEIFPRSANIHFYLGVSYSCTNRHEEAISSFNKAIELDSKFAYAYNNRGNIYRKVGKLELAKADVKKSLALDDENGWTYATRAMIYAEEGDKEAFYKNCELAISKPLAYPLKEQLQWEKTLQRFQEEARFQDLLKQST